MTTPLQGIRILDLGAVIVGPFTGKLLADLGADVIKVEPPGLGDPFRDYEAGFIPVNSGKRSVSLDLRSKSGKHAFLALVRTADVVVENFRPGVMARLGLDYDRLRTENSRLIHCSITGYGTDGPYSHRPAYDVAVQSLSGMLSLLVDAERPMAPGPPIADGVAGLYACYGILGALVERHRTGVGRKVDVSMLESMVAFANQPFGHYFTTGEVQTPTTRASIAQGFVFACADGRMVGIHLSTQEKYWKGLLSAAGRLELADDPRFCSYDLRVRHYDLLTQTLADTFRTRPLTHWLQQLERHEVPFAPVYKIDEVPADPQVRHLGTIFDATRPDEPRGVCSPVFYDGNRDSNPGPAPQCGEHTRSVLAECGLDNADIDRAVNGQ